VPDTTPTLQGVRSVDLWRDATFSGTVTFMGAVQSPPTPANANAAIKAAFFDVDGVLLDSLPQHLAIALDKSIQYGLSVQIPGVAQFREMIAGGAVVSPMLNFFLALGFPLEFARTAVTDYHREFQAKYRPRAFAGVDEALSVLAHAGLKLGLVTSNTRSNTIPALGNGLRYFDPRCLFFFDSYDPPRSKQWCLTEAAQILDCNSQQCVYIGDQPADYRAASAAGCQFLGVTYGWGITRATPGVMLANTIGEVARLLTRQGGPTDDR
jgi:phosphoglycolate phosphatase-like HAD superfamily hydrolase